MLDAKLFLAIFTILISAVSAFAVARYQLKNLAEENKNLTSKVGKLELALERHRADRLEDHLKMYRYADEKYIHSAEFGKLLSGIFSRLERIENKLMNRPA